MDVRFIKWRTRTDSYFSGLPGWADTQYSDASGIDTNSGDAGFIMQHLSESLDIFIGDYRRVDAEACEQLLDMGPWCSGRSRWRAG